MCCGGVDWPHDHFNPQFGPSRRGGCSCRDAARYTIVYLGFPIRGETTPPLIRSFLSQHDTAEQPHKGAILAIILISYVMIVLDISVVLTGLPKIHAQLGFTDANLAWMQSAYTLTFGGSCCWEPAPATFLPVIAATLDHLDNRDSILAIAAANAKTGERRITDEIRMRWSKLKHRVEANFAESIGERVSIHSAAYGACSCGHAWLALDGEVIANFCTRAYYNRFQYSDKERDRGVTPEQTKRHKDQFVDYGEISRQDVYEACWAFVHELSFDDALGSDDPLIQSLAVLDRRLGKRRYTQVKDSALHPLARKLFETRMACELVAI